MPDAQTTMKAIRSIKAELDAIHDNIEFIKGMTFFGKTTL